MPNEKKDAHSEGCCSHHPHEHYENPFEIELAKQIDEFLMKREKSVLHTHHECCGCDEN